MTSTFEAGRVCVAGLGISGAATARALVDEGARVVAVDARNDEQLRATAAELRQRGAEVRLGDAETPVDADLVVTSPGWRPTQPLLVAAQANGVEVIGEPEFAWRLQLQSRQRTGDTGPAWVGVTGTNGKTTTVGMVAAILQAAGYRAAPVGNVGRPLVDAVRAAPAFDLLAVEMSSFQLHWSSTIEFDAAAILNIAADHIDWHGSFDAYVADKARIWETPEGGGAAYVLYNGDDPTCTELAKRFDDRQCFTLAEPGPGCFGVIDDLIVDRSSGLSPDEYADDATREAFERLGGVTICRRDVVQLHEPHNLANALAAVGLARQLNFDPRHRVTPSAIAAGLSAYRPGPHRNAVVTTVDGVVYVDDSKATNAHAAAASLAAYDHVVWIAGGLLKGASVDELVTENAARLRGVVVMGRDRALVRDAVARHAPDVPVAEVADVDTGAMTAVVTAAMRFATPGDTVLLAPAAASMDMFRDYAERGDAFAAAVRRLAQDTT